MDNMPGLSFVRQHAGLFATGAVAIAIALKLTLVSHGSYATATAILRESGTGNVSLGILLTLVSPLLLLPLGMISRFLGASLFEPKESLQARIIGSLGWLAAVLALMLVVSILPSIQPSYMAFVLSGAVLLLGGLEAKQPHSKALLITRKERNSLLLFVFIVFGMMGVINDRPWLPAEEIEVTGEKQMVGYILRDQGTLAILRENDRRVLYFQDAVIQKRTICRAKGDSLRAPLASSWAPAFYKQCPDVKN